MVYAVYDWKTFWSWCKQPSCTIKQICLSWCSSSTLRLGRVALSQKKPKGSCGQLNLQSWSAQFEDLWNRSTAPKTGISLVYFNQKSCHWNLSVDQTLSIKTDPWSISMSPATKVKCCKVHLRPEKWTTRKPPGNPGQKNTDEHKLIYRVISAVKIETRP